MQDSLNRTGVQTERERTREEKIEAVAEKIELLIGDRSLRQVAAASGLTAAGLSNILKRKYLPSADTLRKLSSEKANPQNGVTLGDLLYAAGYQTESLNDVIDYVIKDSMIEVNPFSADGNRSRNVYLRAYQGQLYEMLGKGLVSDALLAKGIHFQLERIDPTAGIETVADMRIQLEDEKVKEWFCLFKDCSERRHLYLDIPRWVGRFFLIPSKPDRKLSIVVNSEDAYQKICMYKDAMSYRGELSVILIDDKKAELISETYLANYDLGDTSKEIYLV